MLNALRRSSTSSVQWRTYQNCRHKCNNIALWWPAGAAVGISFFVNSSLCRQAVVRSGLCIQLYCRCLDGSVRWRLECYLLSTLQACKLTRLLQQPKFMNNQNIRLATEAGHWSPISFSQSQFYEEITFTRKSLLEIRQPKASKALNTWPVWDAARADCSTKFRVQPGQQTTGWEMGSYGSRENLLEKDLKA